MSLLAGQQIPPGCRWFRQLCCLGLLVLLVGCSESPAVVFRAVPDGGIHPRILMDSHGQAHLLYFRPDAPDGRSRLGLLYYRPYDEQNDDWGPAVRVSTDRYEHGDPIFRAGFGIDDEGRVHVAWFQSRPAEYFYTRSNPQRTEFEPQRLIVNQHLEGIDAGVDIAVDGQQIAVVWAAGDLEREAQRSVYLRLSRDRGESFGTETMIGDPALGACACCGLAAEFGPDSQLLVAYRSATNGTGRDMQVLTVDTGPQITPPARYQPLQEDRMWDLAACPVTTNDWVADGKGGHWLVYENRSRIYTLNVPGQADESPRQLSEVPPTTREKHPAVAINAQGYQLSAWGEGAGFFSGGVLRWSLFDPQGRRVNLPAHEAVQIPDNSHPAVMARRDGNFMVLY